ncbi:hypothetical protein B0H14DRAFT_3856171 [Mycena olivaceomarginata]|nr:hypothetical protein B0H14DRAFT_3856171 [Mycena olivaceomarginata]
MCARARCPRHCRARGSALPALPKKVVGPGSHAASPKHQSSGKHRKDCFCLRSLSAGFILDHHCAIGCAAALSWLGDRKKCLVPVYSGPPSLRYLVLLADPAAARVHCRYSGPPLLATPPATAHTPRHCSRISVIIHQPLILPLPAACIPPLLIHPALPLDRLHCWMHTLRLRPLPCRCLRTSPCCCSHTPPPLDHAPLHAHSRLHTYLTAACAHLPATAQRMCSFMRIPPLLMHPALRCLRTLPCCSSALDVCPAAARSRAAVASVPCCSSHTAARLSRHPSCTPPLPACSMCTSLITYPSLLAPRCAVAFAPCCSSHTCCPLISLLPLMHPTAARL